MTRYQYSALRSEIVDFLMAPLFALLDKEKLEWELPSTAKDILGTAYDDVFQIGQDLTDIKDKVKSAYLIHKGTPVAFYLYQLLLAKGLEPKTIWEALDMMTDLSAQDMTLALELSLGYHSDKQKEIDLLDYLDKEVVQAEERWYWYQALTKPQQALDNLLVILREVADRYQDYHTKYQATCQDYASQLDMAKTLSDLGFADTDEVLGTDDERVEVYILSPMHVRFSFISGQEEKLKVHAVFFSVFVDQLIGATSRVDLPALVTILKQVADENRYQVLQALAQGQSKSKAIAEQLGITPAAVSFHTQKLLNSQLLVVNTEDSKVKYLLNKPLLREVLTKLTEDFQLDEK